jgi:hypothetical protein
MNRNRFLRFAFPMLAFAALAAGLHQTDVAARGGGGRGGGGGGMRSSGGARPSGGARTNVTSSNASASRNVNVNSNRNVNRNVNRDVNVNGDRGYYRGGSYYRGGYGYGRPVARAAAATAAVGLTAAAIGSIAYSLPGGCGSFYTYGSPYYNCGGVYYAPQYSGTDITYVVVENPEGGSAETVVE